MSTMSEQARTAAKAKVDRLVRADSAARAAHKHVHRCFHTRRPRILPIRGSETPYSSATVRMGRLSLRICNTCLGVSLHPALRVPMAPLRRPFRTLSCTLSLLVPKKRWFGFIHDGLSQWCRTCNPLGIGCTLLAYATRCANRVFRPTRSTPYPLAFRYAFHSIQPVLIMVALSISVGWSSAI